MNVLVPMPFDLANLAHGRNLRIVHLLAGLAEHGHVTVLVSGSEHVQSAQRVLPGVDVQQAYETAAELPVRGWLAKPLTFLGYSPALLNAVRQWSASGDVVLGFDMPSVVYLLAARSEGDSDGPLTVCDLIDDPWLLWQARSVGERFSVAGVKSAVAMQIVRHGLLRRLDVLTAVAPADAERLSQVTGKTVHVVTNGVHVPSQVPSDLREPIVAFTGAMDFAPNEAAAVYLARCVWPLVRELLPTDVANRTRLALVGANPSRVVRQLQDEPGVEVVGYVDSVPAWLRRCPVAVAPMTNGTGMKNKVLEACAAACAVVATPLGAAGLPTGPENGILLASDAKTLAMTVADLLRDAARARQVGRCGFQMVARQFAWSRSAKALSEIMRTSLPQRMGLVDEQDVPSPRIASLKPKEALTHAPA